MPVFSEDGKVEMAGSGSEHEFPRCDGHGGADFADTKDVKNRLVRPAFLLLRYKVDDSDQKRAVYN
uniref:hypothetical protein n=1 Tax=Escherichia coli TaxID=562 RepID=UPI0003257A0D|nr:hypothetical protein [Escherichia coli]